MAEKKRVTVMVDGMATAPGEEDPFNFQGFQMPPPSASGGAAPVSHHRHNDENEDPDVGGVTSYQTGRKSIVAGVGASDLLHMHRKSLAQLGMGGGGGPADQSAPLDMSAFSGVTLSRRHRASAVEYDEGKVEGQHEALSGFSFGSAE